MANKQTVITLTHGLESQQTIVNKLLHSASKVREELTSLRNFFHAAAGGDRSVKAVVQVNSGDAVAASGTITLSSFAAADTLTVGPEVFTSSASPSGNNQFLSTGGDTVVAAAAAAKIAAHPNLLQYISAVSALAVITLTSKVVGRIGNNLPIAISAHGSVSGSGKLTSGADATLYSSQNTYRSGV